MARARRHDDETTRRGPAGPGPGAATEKGLAATVLGHPRFERVGEVAVATHGRLALSRSGPDFVARDGRQAPLLDPFVSRKELVLGLGRDGLHVERGEHASEVRLEGEPLGATAVIPRERLEGGVTLELADRVALLVHLRAPLPVPRAEALGLVGDSEAMDAVRAAILAVAATDAPVLLRGESGTGKELAAQAVVAASPRRGRPFVAVNVAALPGTLAASELFGHAKGAFTGAAQAHEGAFVRAHRGTLFLDEIGDAPVDVQALLLRALETGEITPLGEGRSRKADVRVIAATDTDLDRAQVEGTFKSALLHRLSGFRIALPPLRARRDDVGRLLFAFLEAELGALGAADRLRRPTDEPPWLPAALVARLAREPWPGNVRQLRNAARQLAIEHRAHATVPLDAVAPAPASVVASGTPAASSAPAPAGSRRRASELDEEAVLRALEETDFRVGKAAEKLGVSRAALYDRLEKTGTLRTASDLGREEIVFALAVAGGDVVRAAHALRVSSRGLTLRMRALGLGS